MFFLCGLLFSEIVYLFKRLKLILILCAGYPTIKSFAGGKKDSQSVSDYNGGRTASEIVNWAIDKLAENIPAPEVLQVSSSPRQIRTWDSALDS